MKNFRIIFLLAGMIMAISAFDASAQRKPHKTASARAAYGHRSSSQNLNFTKKQKVLRHNHNRPAKGTKGSRPDYGR
jgi:hypothetical protein